MSYLTHDARLAPVAPLELYDLDAYRRARAEQGGASSSGRLRVDLYRQYKPHAGQRRLHALHDKRFVAVVAGRRGGKTTGMAAEFWRRVFRDYARFKASGGTWAEPSHYGGDVKGAVQYWIVAPTYRHTLLMWQALFELLGGTDSPLIVNYNRSENRLWLVGGIKIEARSADTPTHLVGDSLNGVWVDESARVKELAWTDNIKPNLDDRGGWGLFSTTPLGFNWFWREIWERTQLGTGEARDERFAAARWTTADNTAIPSLAAEMRLARLMLPKAIFERNYLASFTAFEGKVFSSFTGDSTHVVQSVPYGSLVQRWGGIDWGTGNPGVQLELGLDETGRVWVMREDYAAGLPVAPPSSSPSADCWVNRFKTSRDRRRIDHWWADPSGAGNLLTCTREGLEVYPALNDVQAGIDVLAALLEPVPRAKGGRPEPGLLIHRSCTNLIRELVSYRWNDSGEKPVKEDDHTVDALRYGVFTEHHKGTGGQIQTLDWSIFDNLTGARAAG